MIPPFSSKCVEYSALSGHFTAYAAVPHLGLAHRRISTPSAECRVTEAQAVPPAPRRLERSPCRSSVGPPLRGRRKQRLLTGFPVRPAIGAQGMHKAPVVSTGHGRPAKVFEKHGLIMDQGSVVVVGCGAIVGNRVVVVVVIAG